MTKLFPLLILGLAGLLAACGPASPTPSASNSASAQPSASVSASPSAGASGSPGASAADYLVDAKSLPPGSQQWSVVADGTLNGVAASHQRVFQSGDGSQRIEIDVLLDSSSGAATSDYSGWESTIHAKVDAKSSPSCPGALGPNCKETVGTTKSSGESTLVFTWQNSEVLIAILYANTAGGVDQAYGEDVAKAEDTWIIDTALGI